MISHKNLGIVFAALLASALSPLSAQTGSHAPKGGGPAKSPAPTVHPGTAPTDTQAPPPQPDSNHAQEAAPSQDGEPDRAVAYYHYSLAHMYEELVQIYQRSDLASKAIDEYKLAIQSDPTSGYLNSGLAELYFKTGRIRDAVLESQEIIGRDPGNLEARKLLGRIYLRSLGDMQSGTQSQEVLQLALEQFQQIVKLEPKNVDDHLLLGRLLILNKDLVKAEDEFKAALRLQPDSEEAVINLGYLYNEEGNTAKAIQTLSAVPDPQKSAKVYSALGYSFEQQHDYKRAVEVYRKSIELDHDNLDTQRGLAQNLLNVGSTEAALEQYKQIAEADPQDAQILMRIAEIYRRQGKYDQALQNLQKAEVLVPESQEVPYNEALIYEAQGKYDPAVQLLQKLVEKNSKPGATSTPGERNNQALFVERLGYVYRETNRYPQAIETFRKLLAFGDDNAIRGYQAIIDTFRESRQWQQATSAAEEAVKKIPGDRGLKIALGKQLADTGKIDEGVALVKAQLKGDADDKDVYLELSQLNTRLKRWKDADDALDQAEKLSSKQEDKVFILFLHGSNYERQKKYDLAEESFRKVLAIDPQNAGALNYLGYMLADRGVRLDEAVSMIRKAVDLEPANGSYLDSLGWAYYKIGNAELAEENLRKATERMDNDGTVHDHLGDVYQKNGKLKLAAAQWERALEEWNRSIPADVDSVDIAKAQKKLESAKMKLARQSGQ